MATIREKANRVANKGLNAAEETVENVRSAKNQANRRYGGQMDDMENQASHAAEEFGRRLRQTYESGVEELEGGTEKARYAVRQSPLLAVAGAFVGGLLAAALMRR